MHIPEGIPYGHFLENLELSNPPPRKIAFFFANLDLEKLRPPGKKSLVQPPGQTVRPTTIKIGMHLPKGVPYGRFSGNFKN